MAFSDLVIASGILSDEHTECAFISQTIAMRKSLINQITIVFFLSQYFECVHLCVVHVWGIPHEIGKKKSIHTIARLECKQKKEREKQQQQQKQKQQRKEL